MQTVFLICAVIGGTVLVCQFVMTMLGLGDDGSGFDDLPDAPDEFDVQTDPSDGGHLADAAHTSTTWLFSVISFRTVVAAMTFFGLAGMAGSSGGMAPLPTMLIALAAGAAAMGIVHQMMRGLSKLSADGTVRIERSVGMRGRVYIPIPGHKQGVGKVQVRVQDRITEYQAMTSEPDKLPTGARVVVTGVIGPDTVDVELVPEVVEAREAD